MCTNICWEGMTYKESDSSQWCPLTRQEAMDTIKKHENPPEHKKNLFQYEGGQTQEWVSQRGCGLCRWRYSKFDWA